MSEGGWVRRIQPFVIGTRLSALPDPPDQGEPCWSPCPTGHAASDWTCSSGLEEEDEDEEEDSLSPAYSSSRSIRKIAICRGGQPGPPDPRETSPGPPDLREADPGSPDPGPLDQRETDPGSPDPRETRTPDPRDRSPPYPGSFDPREPGRGGPRGRQASWEDRPGGAQRALVSAGAEEKLGPPEVNSSAGPRHPE